jgi:hypothetical protein
MTHSPEIVKQVKDLYLSGVKAKKIREITGLTVGQFQAMVYHKYQWHLRVPRKVGKSTPEKPIEPNVIDRIVNLTNWGYHCHEIAEDQGLPLYQVSKIVEEAKNFGRIQKRV